MPGKHYTADELAAWQGFFREGGTMPRGRKPQCALRRLNPQPIADLRDQAVAHATAAAAMRHLRKIPMQEAGDRAAFVEAVQKAAVRPWLEYRAAAWPPEVFAAAKRAAIEAIRRLQANQPARPAADHSETSEGLL